MNFSDLHLIAPLLRAVAETGYETPSPIQQQAIPPVLEGRDLLGCAQTGTGKTAAFALPILQRLAATEPQKGKKRPIRALILTPTRELALQIDESFAAYGKHMKLRHCVIFGGVNQNPQVAQLNTGVDILTATPGRLNDLIGQGHIRLAEVEIFVLDEADRMLDMGFVHDVKRVLTYLPKQKQTLLFSATMPREIEELANGLLHNPAKVMVAPPATTVESIEQSIYFVDKGNKRHLLAKLLQNREIESALVFTRTKHGADKVVRELGREGVGAKAIHGNKSQNARQDALAQFKDGSIRVLVATDIAARGIDINNLSHVFNYDLPNIPETYVHRIGRTGRAGRGGVAVSFCDFEEKAYLADIEKLTKIKIPVVEHAWPMAVFEIPEKKTQARPARSQQQPARAKAAKPAKKQSEEKKMESETKQPAAQQPGQAGDDPAKRRRPRGGRRHGKGNGAAQGEMQTQQFAKQQPAKQQAQQKPAPQKPEQRPARTERPAKQAAAPKPAPAPRETDDSIQVISRKAPAQKYTSFEEYMKAHGTGEA